MKAPSLLLGILAAGIAVVGSGCKSEVDKIRIEFIDSCKQSGATTKVCKCAFDQIEDHYGEDRLIAVQRSGEMPGDFVSTMAGAALQCRAK